MLVVARDQTENDIFVTRPQQHIILYICATPDSPPGAFTLFFLVLINAPCLSHSLATLVPSFVSAAHWCGASGKFSEIKHQRTKKGKEDDLMVIQLMIR